MDLERDNGKALLTGVKVKDGAETSVLPDLGKSSTEVINALLKSESPFAIELDRNLTAIQATLNEYFQVKSREATLGAIQGLSDKTLNSLVGELSLPEQQRQKILSDLLQGGRVKDAAVETIATELTQVLQSRDASLISVAEILSKDRAFQDAHPELAARLLASLRDVTKTLSRAQGEETSQPMVAELNELPIFGAQGIPSPSLNQGNNSGPLAPIVAEAVIATAVVLALANAATAEERKNKDLLQRAMEEAERMQKAAEERIKSAISAFEARTGQDVPENFDVAYRTDPPSDAELRSSLTESERSESEAA